LTEQKTNGIAAVNQQIEAINKKITSLKEQLNKTHEEINKHIEKRDQLNGKVKTLRQEISEINAMKSDCRWRPLLNKYRDTAKKSGN
jgi:uncharacterized coiled-coil DUF342 family protein